MGFDSRSSLCFMEIESAGGVGKGPTWACDLYEFFSSYFLLGMGLLLGKDLLRFFFFYSKIIKYTLPEIAEGLTERTEGSE